VQNQLKVIQDLVCHEMVDCVLIFHQMRKVSLTSEVWKNDGYI